MRRDDVLDVEDGPTLRHLDRRRDVPLLEREGGGVEGRAETRHRVGGADLGLAEGHARVLAGEGLQRLGVAGLVRGQAGGELLGAGLGELPGALGGEAGADLLLDQLERLRAAGALAGDLEDVIAERGLHRPHQLARLGAEGRVLELLDHAVAAEVADVAALVLRGGVVGVLLGHGGEVGAAVELLLRLLRAGLRLRVVALVVDHDQDVAGLHLVFLGVLGLVGVVVGPQVRLARIHLAGELGVADQQVGQVALLGQLELRLVGLEERLDLVLRRAATWAAKLVRGSWT